MDANGGSVFISSGYSAIEVYHWTNLISLRNVIANARSWVLSDTLIPAAKASLEIGWRLGRICFAFLEYFHAIDSVRNRRTWASRRLG